MRELTRNEMSLVAGAGDDCSSGGSGNNLGGITNSGGIGDDLINIYEGLVSAASHMIERVARAL
ncbi:MAG: hypothetical protein MUO51_05885 [Woeseiaceae bacterium]|nr:hypothetical protein [Woeseiaceae bacterium]